MKQKVVCFNCNKEFERYPSLIEGRTFCSKECHDQYRTVHIYTCKYCKKIFHRKIKIDKRISACCSQKCRWKQVQLDLASKPNCICKYCKKAFRVRPYALKNGEGKYCSRKCKGLFLRGPESTHCHYYGLTSWRETRQVVLERDNFTCLRCGNKERQLHVNHIKFRELGGTDELSNLETLCRNCHATVDSERLKKLTKDDKATFRKCSKKLTDFPREA